MSTSNTNVTAGDIVSATRKYSNKDNEGRLFNISADVNIKGNKASAFNNGQVVKKDEPTNGSANFSKGESWMSFNSNNLSDEETSQAFIASMDFMKDVEDSVTSQSAE